MIRYTTHSKDRYTTPVFCLLDKFFSSAIIEVINPYAMSHYHSTLKGCKFIKFYLNTEEEDRWVEARYCLVCKKVCCRCGYEFGYHYSE